MKDLILTRFRRVPDDKNGALGETFVRNVTFISYSIRINVIRQTFLSAGNVSFAKGRDQGSRNKASEKPATKSASTNVHWAV